MEQNTSTLSTIVACVAEKPPHRRPHGQVVQTFLIGIMAMDTIASLTPWFGARVVLPYQARSGRLVLNTSTRNEIVACAAKKPCLQPRTPTAQTHRIGTMAMDTVARLMPRAGVWVELPYQEVSGRWVQSMNIQRTTAVCVASRTGWRRVLKDSGTSMLPRAASFVPVPPIWEHPADELAT